MLSIVPSAPETSAKPTKAAGGTVLGAGRRLSEALISAVQQTLVGKEPGSKAPPMSIAPSVKTQKKRTTKKTTNMKELERMLEEDALNLLNMRKEMAAAKGEELAKVQHQFNEVRKEFDHRWTANESKARELREINNRIKQLRDVATASVSTNHVVDDQAQSLQQQIAAVMTEYECEMRTARMQQLMHRRMEEEIAQCRKNASFVSMDLDQIRHEYNAALGSMESNKHDLAEQERKLDKMVDTVKSRRKERESKMAMLQGLVHNSEASLLRIQQTNSPIDMTSSMFSPGGAPSPTMNNTQRAATGHSRMSSKGADKVGDIGEFDDITDPDRSKTLSVAQIKELIERHRSREARLQKIQQLDAELRSTIKVLREKNLDITSNLTRTATKYQQLASSRQVYQEVDMKDAALNAARKECDDCQEREHRLRLNIESVRRALPRFLTKLTKQTPPIPTVDQLPDMVLKLEDELSKLIKNISAAMMKDATPEDLQLLAQQNQQQNNNNDSKSEIEKLRSLPGFSRMQRALFFNLMSARPDVSDKNIRIRVTDPEHQPAKKHLNFGDSVALEDGMNRRNRAAMSNSTLGVKDDDLRVSAVSSTAKAVNVPILDRDLVKDVSKLVVERDAAGFMAALAKSRRDQMQATGGAGGGGAEYRSYTPAAKSPSKGR